MARNAVQFQKGLSEPEFDRQYGTEEQCRAVVIGLRWPEGVSKTWGSVLACPEVMGLADA